MSYTHLSAKVDGNPPGVVYALLAGTPHVQLLEFPHVRSHHLPSIHGLNMFKWFSFVMFCLQETSTVSTLPGSRPCSRHSSLEGNPLKISRLTIVCVYIYTYIQYLHLSCLFLYQSVCVLYISHYTILHEKTI